MLSQNKQVYKPSQCSVQCGIRIQGRFAQLLLPTKYSPPLSQSSGTRQLPICVDSFPSPTIPLSALRVSYLFSLLSLGRLYFLLLPVPFLFSFPPKKHPRSFLDCSVGSKRASCPVLLARFRRRIPSLTLAAPISISTSIAVLTTDTETRHPLLSLSSTFYTTPTATDSYENGILIARHPSSIRSFCASSPSTRPR